MALASSSLRIWPRERGTSGPRGPRLIAPHEPIYWTEASASVRPRVPDQPLEEPLLASPQCAANRGVRLEDRQKAEAYSIEESPLSAVMGERSPAVLGLRSPLCDKNSRSLRRSAHAVRCSPARAADSVGKENHQITPMGINSSSFSVSPESAIIGKLPQCHQSSSLSAPGHGLAKLLDFDSMPADQTSPMVFKMRQKEGRLPVVGSRIDEGPFDRILHRSQLVSSRDGPTFWAETIPADDDLWCEALSADSGVGAQPPGGLPQGRYDEVVFKPQPAGLSRKHDADIEDQSHDLCVDSHDGVATPDETHMKLCIALDSPKNSNHYFLQTQDHRQPRLPHAVGECKRKEAMLRKLHNQAGECVLLRWDSFTLES